MAKYIGVYKMNNQLKEKKMYQCWLDYKLNKNGMHFSDWKYGNTLYISSNDKENEQIQAGIEEFIRFFKDYWEKDLVITNAKPVTPHIELKIMTHKAIESEGYRINIMDQVIEIQGSSGVGVLYGIFEVIARIRQKRNLVIGEEIKANPQNPIRMINHWDNLDGSIERGYAGRSIFYNDYQITSELERIKDYARLLASIGINSITLNNVNVHNEETKFMTEVYLGQISEIAKVFSRYGIKTFLSINFAAPLQLSNIGTADPLTESVQKWWESTTKTIYKYIPNLGGILVKADSENRPGPFTYNRTHADGANMLAKVLEPYGGVVIWRCFVYNCHVDWRDRKTDRARAAYDHFKALDGQFAENVILQIKNGPMDFQIREAVSPLFGAMPNTNQMMEFQITQEYTGQQKHVCFLVPLWKECLEFDTYAQGKGTYVKDIVAGKTFKYPHSGMAAVVNIGDSVCWTGSPLAAANLYGYGRLCWNPEWTSETIALEWIYLTLGDDESVVQVVKDILLTSRATYENYTVPLGIGWMVNVGHHYGPNIEGYEYSGWGTYHYADYKGIGVDRTMATGTGYTSQYFEPNCSMYESKESCPEELLLFFHHVGYDEKLKDGRTLQQYIYDVHFEGVEKAEEYVRMWRTLEGKIEKSYYEKVYQDLKLQVEDAIEWRDIINTYFYRKNGIGDCKGRVIYP